MVFGHEKIVLETQTVRSRPTHQPSPTWHSGGLSYPPVIADKPSMYCR